MGFDPGDRAGRGRSRLLAVLVGNEARVEQPIMPLRLFRSRERSGAYATRMLYLGAMIGFFFFTTQLLQDALGFTPLQAGLGFLPMTLVNFAVAMAIPRLGTKVPNAVLLTVGVAVTLVGMVWLSRAGAGDTYVGAVALPMVLVGAGQGLAFAPLTNAGISGVAPADAGAPHRGWSTHRTSWGWRSGSPSWSPSPHGPGPDWKGRPPWRHTSRPH